MKILFDSQQDYQLDAIRSVVDVFEGQPLAAGDHEVAVSLTGTVDLTAELGVANTLILGTDRLFANVQAVQRRHGLPETDRYLGDHFSVEMETGTGKTYVYLRTLFELNRRYGWKKFVIVVPSVAIREGVMTSIEMTREHFAGLYGNQPLDAWIYDSAQVSKLRQFATSNQMQVLVMNLQAFDKASTVIQNPHDRLSGRRPIEFIQNVRPIVVLDEPQNMETENASRAIASLTPLCTLRYSATHKNPYNLLYRLDPVQAYDLRLVKRVEVDSVLDGADFNHPYVRVLAIEARKTGISAKVEIDLETAGGVKRKAVTVANRAATWKNQDLFEASGRRENYRGYLVNEIDAGRQVIAFANGLRLKAGETHGGRTNEILREQIRQTILNHFEKEMKVAKLPAGRRLKVLSLFFVDRVAHYAAADGKFRRWFEEAYREVAARPEHADLHPLPVEQVHNGYFAQDKSGPKDTNGATKADDEAYNLIMHAKERLLSLEEPLRFIFSHSALREGWDNPNVFQLCTLREISTERERRQTLGRGMRLPVREDGLRCRNANVNTLTVVASESFADFARQLQTELRDECGVNFEGRILNKRERRVVRLKKQRLMDPDFQILWDKIKHKTRYAVHFSTADVVKRAAGELRSMPAVQSPFIQVTKAQVGISTKEGVTIQETASAFKAVERQAPIPDLIGYLQRETEMTRSTLAAILFESGRLGEVMRNPQQFLDQAVAAILHTLHELMVDGIKYEKIAGQAYEMMLFEMQELECYVSRLVTVQNGLYEAVEFESQIEADFARQLDARKDIKLFFKLPDWFKIDTPLGTYNPDWAIVKEEADGKNKVYLVRETKSGPTWLDIPKPERDKIRCGQAHFSTLDVDYAWVTSASQV